MLSSIMISKELDFQVACQIGIDQSNPAETITRLEEIMHECIYMLSQPVTILAKCN